MNRMTLLLLVGCVGMDSRSEPAAPPPTDAPGRYPEDRSDGTEGGAGNQKAPAPIAAGASAAAPMGRVAEMDESSVELRAKAKDGRRGLSDDEEKADHEAAPTRSWFPESFLWVPLVETDATGQAMVPIAVPDSLTTWRVLALGQTATGAQGGAEAKFLSTLPAYVDVVVPGRMFAGDELFLPVQVVNTTGEGMSEPLAVRVHGGTGAASGSLAVGAGGSATRTVSVTAGGPGTATIRADYGIIDSVERSVPIMPVGRMVESMQAGAVSSAKPLHTEAVPSGANGELLLTAWPGALSVVRAEIEGPPIWIEREPIWGGNPLGDAAYRYALAAAGAALDPAETQPDALRSMRLSAWQPLARAGRAPDTATACLLAEALRGADPATLDGRLAARMAETVAEQQAPDGTWLTGAYDIDTTLVETALCARAVNGDDAARLRAEGAFDRHQDRLEDPALAAYALASGTISDADLHARLVETVKKGLVSGTDGTQHLEPGGLHRADGHMISLAEATAAGALALRHEPGLAGELATAVLGMHRAWGGWSDGEGDLLVLRALSEALPNPDSPPPELVVTIDGVEVARATVDPTEPHKPIIVRAPALATTAHEIVISGGGPGLAFTMSSRAWVPWGPAERGVAEIGVDAPNSLAVGALASVHVRVATPSSVPTDLILGLPAGVRADPDGMDRLVSQGAFSSWTGSEGSILIKGLAGGGWEGDVPVMASLGGRASTAPTRLLRADTGESLFVLPPTAWTIGS